MHLSADDTVIYASEDNIVSAIEAAQGDLIKIAQWCDNNKLTINIFLKAMAFGTKQ